MSDTDLVAHGTELIINFMFDVIQEQDPAERARFYRDVGLDLIELSVHLAIEQDSE